MSNYYLLRKSSLLLLTLVAFTFTKVQAQVSLTATTGTTSGTYTTLAAALAAINAGTHTGAIVVNITANTTETATAFVNASGAGSASYTSITIQAGANNVAVSGTGSTIKSLLVLNGASNITIDGHNPANTGQPNSRDLTFANTNTATTTATATIRLGSTSSTGCSNITIRNCIIKGNTTTGALTTATEFGILAGLANNTSTTAAPTSTPAMTTGPGPYANVTIQNNQITTCGVGIYMGGSATTSCPGLSINNNVIGSNTPADYVFSSGITVNGSTSGDINNNTIMNIIGSFGSSAVTAASTFPKGIFIGTVCNAVTIRNNTITNVQNMSTGGWPARGIGLYAGDNHVVYNNFVSGVKEYESASNLPTYGAVAIYVNTGLGHNISYNSLSCQGAWLGGSSGIVTHALMAFNGTGSTGMTVKNNIFDQGLTGSTSGVVCAWFYGTVSSAYNLTWNNNAYYRTSTQTNTGHAYNYNGGGTATMYTTFAAMAAYTATLSSAGTNDNASGTSAQAAPFLSTSDLHVNGGASNANIISNTGSIVAGITTDIDGGARSGTTPDIGADEFVIPTCFTPNSLAVSAITGTTATISWAVPSGGSSPVNYLYSVSATSGVPTGTLTATSSISNPVTGLSPQTTYYVYVRTNCGAGDSSLWISTSFTTPCAFATLTKREGFNTASTALPTCWSAVTVATVGTAPALTDETITSNPSGYLPFEGSRMVRFNSFNCGNGSQIRLVSLPLSTVGVNSVDLTYYWLHDNTNYTTSGYLTEGVQVQYSLNASTWTDAGPFVARLDGGSGALWYQKGLTLPTTVANQSPMYIGFLFTSRFGNDCYLDSVTISPSVPVDPSGVNSTVCVSASTPVVPTCSVTTNNGTWAAHTYKWYLVPAGGTAIAGESGASLSAYTVAPGSVTTFYVAEANGNIESGRIAVTATVNQSPAVVNNPVAALTVCQGATTVIGFTGAPSGTPSPAIQWQVSTNGGGAWSNISGATTNTLIFTASMADSGSWYRAVFTNICGTANTTVCVLTVNRLPAITTHPTNTTVCPGSNAALSIAAVGTGISYQWQESINGGSSWSSLINAGIYSGVTTTNFNITGASISMNGYVYRCVVSGTCTPPASSLQAILTVNNSVAISQHPQNIIVCNGVNGSFSVVASGSGLGYQWQENQGAGFNNVTNGGVYSGATAATLNLIAPLATMNGYVYRCVVTSACTAPVNTSTAVLTVNTAPTVSTQPVSVTACEGTNPSFTVGISAVGTITYQWQQNTGSGFVNLPATIFGYTGQMSPTLTLINPTVAFNGYQFRCIISGQCAPAAVSNTVVLTMQGQPKVTVQPTDRHICVGSNTSFNLTATGTGISYQWQQNTGSGYSDIINGGVYSGATTNILSLSSPTAAMTGTDYRCIITGTCTPAAISSVVKLYMNTPPVVTSQPSDRTVCAGSSTNFIVYASAQSSIVPVTYQWQVNDGTGFVNIINGTPYSGATTNTLTVNPVTVVMNTYRYQCIISASCGPTAKTNLVTLTINTLPAVVQHPQDVTACPTTTTTFSVVGSGTGVQYKWQENKGTGYVNMSDNATYSGSGTPTLSIVVSPGMNNWLYRCVLSTICLPNAISNGARLNALNPVVISEHTITDTVCEGGTTKIGVSASGISLKYQWQKKTTGGYVDLLNIPPYSGVNTDSLRFTLAPDTIGGNLYRCRVYETILCGLSFYTADIPLGMNYAPVTSPPLSTVDAGQIGIFTVPATNPNSKYIWQEDRNDGSGFRDLPNGSPYLIANNTLTISPVNSLMNGNKYRCIIEGICKSPMVSKFAVLTVKPGLSVSSLKGTIGMSIYPNPLEGTKLNISVSKVLKGITEVRVLDKLGKLVYSTNIYLGVNTTGTIELNALAAGVYTLQVNNISENVLESVRFTKQ